MGIFGIFKQQTTVNPVVDQQVHQRQHENASVVAVLTPPMALDSSSEVSTSDNRSSSGVGRLLDLFKGVGSDLTRFQVPVNFNMPKSQLQLYGELVYCFHDDLLTKCAQASNPLDRFLAVVRWHISTTRPAPFGKAPYNPIQGEIHHVSVGDLNVLLEQVSHHPPISALHATNEKEGIELSFWHQPSPKFYGNGVEVTIHGRRFLNIKQYNETYELTSPKLGFRFLPVLGSDWSGNTIVSCAATGLKATITFKSKAFFGFHGSNRRISGRIFDAHHTLYEISGNWDQCVTMKDKATGEATVLYDGKVALTKLHSPQLVNPNGLSPMESAVVWSGVSEGIMNRDIEKARACKIAIEEQQRKLRKERQVTGMTWSPKYFRKCSNGVDWEWMHPQESVLTAPIVVPAF